MVRRSVLSIWCAAGSFLVVSGGLLAAQNGSDRGDVLTTGVTGRVDKAGLEDPQYLLSFPEVQRLALRCAAGPITLRTAAEGLQGTPVTTDHLLAAGLLRKEDAQLWLDYSLLTVEDQRLLHTVCEDAGRDLAGAFEEHREEFDRLLQHAPAPALREEIAFALLCGVVLNWEGLRIAADLGLRSDAPDTRHYEVHSYEIGHTASSKAMYWGSHTFPGGRMSLTTFGDGPSQPRANGFPDILTETAEAGMASVRDRPELYGALRSFVIVNLTEELELVAGVMERLATSPAGAAALQRELDVSGATLQATLALLVETDYVARDDDGRYVPNVPVFTRQDAPWLSEIQALGREIVRDWLASNHGRLRDRLGELSALQQGVQFERVFGEVWHYVFGYAAKTLAEEGFCADPYAPGAAHVGFVPIVWDSSLFEAP